MKTQLNTNIEPFRYRTAVLSACEMDYIQISVNLSEVYIYIYILGIPEYTFSHDGRADMFNSFNNTESPDCGPPSSIRQFLCDLCADCWSSDYIYGIYWLNGGHILLSCALNC